MTRWTRKQRQTGPDPEQSCTVSVGVAPQSHCCCRSKPAAAPPAGRHGSYLEDVLVSGQAVGLPADVEGDDRK